MQKTLGGDRLGAGKKMTVDLHGYERSTHDLGFVKRTTMSAGTLVPLLCKPMTPGDTWDLNLDIDVKTLPTIGPLFGSYKVQMDVFMIPIRLYNSLLHNNTLHIGRQMSQVKIPQIRLTQVDTSGYDLENGDIDNSQINPSSLLPYLGIRGIGINNNAASAQRYFNALGILMYWDIYKNYYANKQEEIGAVIHTPSEALVTTITGAGIRPPVGAVETLPQAPTNATIDIDAGSVFRFIYTGTAPIQNQITVMLDGVRYNLVDISNTWVEVTPGEFEATYNNAYGPTTAMNWDYVSATDMRPQAPAVQTFALSQIDEMRKAILSLWDTTTALVINGPALEPYKWLYEQPNGVPNLLSSQEGLALKTYQSDLFNNWLKTENIDAITSSTAVDTSGGSFTIDQLTLSRKVYNMLNRINVSGGSYDDWIDAVYAHEGYRRAESPMYMGGLSKELVFQEVVSNSESESGQPLGTLAGKGVMSGKHKGGQVVVKADEPAYIMILASLTPRIDYSQGNDWDVHLRTLDDLHKPALDEIGFQELITEQMAWWDTQWNGTTWVQKSAGKQPAWINYMTAYNQCYGNFAIKTKEMFMTLNRRYDVTNTEDGIADLTTYIDPSKFNFIFAETKLDAQNFWVQVAVDITARRKMSGKLMPNL